ASGIRKIPAGAPRAWRRSWSEGAGGGSCCRGTAGCSGPPPPGSGRWSAPMGDHPVLIPTSMGCLEGVVSEPEGVPLMAAVILPGGGGRFGPGRVWRRLARGLADAGVVTLRVDYPERGATGGNRARARRHAAVQEAVEWFAGRTGELRILLVGYCYGTRVILRRAPHWDRVAGAALV